MLQRYWFGDVDEQGCRGADTDPAALAKRAATLCTDMDSYVPIDWEVARDCGVVRTREEYIDLLREVCTRLAREKITVAYQARDVGSSRWSGCLTRLILSSTVSRSVPWSGIRSRIRRSPGNAVISRQERCSGSSGGGQGRSSGCSRRDRPAPWGAEPPDAGGLGPCR